MLPQLSIQLVQDFVDSGEKFVVDLNLLVEWVGYSTKQKAKNKLFNNFDCNTDYTITQMVKRVEGNNGGGSVRYESIKLTVDCFKSMCMMAGTPKGKEVRAYFLECEKTAKVAAQVIPQQSDRIKELELQIMLANAERDRAMAEQKVLDTRHYITTVLPEPVQQKILGYQLVEKVEYRDRIVKDDCVLNDGSTINKTALCNRYGLLTKAGKPDYKKLNEALSKSGLPGDAFELVTKLQEYPEFKREYLPDLDRIFLNDSRQLYLGENS